MPNQQAGLPAGWLPTKLREALAQLPGSVSLLPSLPVLEVGVMGQHILVTFCLGPPPPTLLGPPSSFGPAVTLHLIWPYGYWYWQPETGTADYIGGVPRPEQLPAIYQQVLSQRSQQPPFAAIDSPSLDRYLTLIEEVLQCNWLSPHADVTPIEKQVASELQQLWNELGEAPYQDYYRLRGSTLLTWLEQATYQPSWVEEAIESLAASAPLTMLPPNTMRGILFPAWLDGRQCIVVPFFKATAVEASTVNPTVELVAACYLAYPNREVYWHLFSSQQAQAKLAAPALSGQPLPTVLKHAATSVAPGLQATIQYYQLVTELLKSGWLVTRHPTSPAETALASKLVEAFANVSTPELTTYYLREAWQLVSWLTRATEVLLP